MVTIIVAVLVFGAARALLTAPIVAWVRRATMTLAAGSALATAAGWLLARPWAIEALGRAVLLAAVVLACLGAMWSLRSRLRPRGFAATQRRYASYRRVK